MPGGGLGAGGQTSHLFKKVSQNYLAGGNNQDGGDKNPNTYRSDICKTIYRDSLDTVLDVLASKSDFTTHNMNTFQDSDLNLDRLKTTFKNAIMGSNSTCIYESNTASTPKYAILRKGKAYSISNLTKYIEFIDILAWRMARDFAATNPQDDVGVVNGLFYEYNVRKNAF